MQIETPICKMLGIKHPIFAFTHEVDVAVAVARSGGFPILGLARELPEDIPAVIAKAEARLGGLPYGIDFMVPAHVPNAETLEAARASLPKKQVDFVAGLRKKFSIGVPHKASIFTAAVRSQELFDDQIDAALGSKAIAVVTAIGLRKPLIDEAKRRGKLTFALVGAPRHARKALDLHVDVLVAQGYDAGGHTGPIGTMALLPQIVSMAGATPVLAAGGLATGSQILGCIAMGAQGGWLGTLWLAAAENHTPSALLQRLIDSGSIDTVITRAHSGKPCRVVRSSWIDAWSESSAPRPLEMPLQQVLTGDVFTAIHETNDPQLIYEAAGQSVFGITQPTTVAAQIQTLVREMNEAYASLLQLIDPSKPRNLG